MPSNTVLKLVRDIGQLKKGDHVIIIAATKTCCGGKFTIKHETNEIYQCCCGDDLKPLK